MIVYPAIDLYEGRVVRLREGDPRQQTTFSEDPVETAQQWVDGGAEWLHLVNLDSALSVPNENALVMKDIAQLNVRVQYGGGLRTLEAIEKAFERGASRVVLGTVAVQQPEIVLQALELWGADAICVALDARNGKIATHGWLKMSEMTPIEFGKAMAAEGVRHALYTDVARDGVLTGVNVKGTALLAQETGLQVIASGGVASLDDIRRLRATGCVAGVIIGMALYEGRFTLQEALGAAV
jgi:phosphoribosylformimino-5-aminoimidazole carboxamide ribotide isomerase